MHIAKVHVKTRPPLTSNSIPDESDATVIVRRFILLAARLPDTMLMAVDGPVSHIDPAGAKTCIDATVTVNSEMDKRYQDIVERNDPADEGDVFLINYVFSEMEEQLNSLQGMPKGIA